MADKKAPAAPQKNKAQKVNNSHRWDLLHVPKSVKIWAAMDSMRHGSNFKQNIKMLGEADRDWRRYGYLVIP